MNNVNKGNSKERLAAEISKDLKEIVQFELGNESIGFMTITNVVVSSDHSYAKVFVSFFNNPEKNLQKLNNAKGYVRSKLAKKLKTRRVPEISFVLDDSFFKQESLENALKKEGEELESLKK